jgi:transcriptional regulator with XRE-family HTH domain
MSHECRAKYTLKSFQVFKLNPKIVSNTMKMKQPDLGKKIAELRKARGFTQEELVEKCNLSVRTLQRIESGEVAPRSHTIRVIFEALDYRVFDSANNRLRLLLKKTGDLFNLKTNTMKKLSVLTLIFAAATFVLLAICIDGNAQSEKKVRKIIEENNRNLVRWFNAGQVDSLLTLYRNDACLAGEGCGKAVIRDFYLYQTSIFHFDELGAVSVSVADSIAVERGQWSGSTTSGIRLRGAYLTEWRRNGKTWQIVNDISTSE